MFEQLSCDFVFVFKITRQRMNSLDCLDFQCLSKKKTYKKVCVSDWNSQFQENHWVTYIIEHLQHASSIRNTQRSKDIDSPVFRTFFCVCLQFCSFDGKNVDILFRAIFFSSPFSSLLHFNHFRLLGMNILIGCLNQDVLQLNTEHCATFSTT